MNAVTRAEMALIETPVVRFTLNGKQVEARANETVIQVADREAQRCRGAMSREIPASADHSKAKR